MLPCLVDFIANYFAPSGILAWLRAWLIFLHLGTGPLSLYRVQRNYPDIDFFAISARTRTFLTVKNLTVKTVYLCVGTSNQNLTSF